MKETKDLGTRDDTKQERRDREDIERCAGKKKYKKKYAPTRAPVFHRHPERGSMPPKDASR